MYKFGIKNHLSYFVTIVDTAETGVYSEPDGNDGIGTSCPS
jgi:hypothetical protein